MGDRARRPARRSWPRVLWVLVLCGCAAAKPVPPPPAIDAAGGNELRFILAWQGSADLDLYVTDPAAETVYFANTPSRSGGRLVRDQRCGAAVGEARYEEVVWEAPPPGRYRVGVDDIESCDGAAGTQLFRLVVSQGAARRELTAGVEPERFLPVVMELELRAPVEGGPALLEATP
jgi:hypothetical protein